VLEGEGGLSPAERASVARIRKIAEETLAGGAPCQTAAECDDAVACRASRGRRGKGRASGW